MTVIHSMRFGVNWDYRCPFARNIHEHLVTALKAGADWEVEFIPFSLTQVHIEEDEPSVWDDPTREKDLHAIAAGLIVRRDYPEIFYDLHLDLFSARHDQAKDITDWNVVAEVLTKHGLDAAAIRKEIKDGDILKVFRSKHEESVEKYQVFGVPTFFVNDTATFARVMTRPKGDSNTALATIEYVLDAIVNHSDFNEIKHTQIPR
jgi:hypothetical protein